MSTSTLPSSIGRNTHQARPPLCTSWHTRAELANAIFEWIEAFYNPVRRHSALGYNSPIDFEHLHTAAPSAA